MITLRKAATAVALLALAVWLGGLVTLGALVAPTIFSQVPVQGAATAMTVVFQRFDLVAMACAAVLLATEAVRAVARVPFARLDHARAALSVVASAAAVYEATSVSPRIAALHAAGVVRGMGDAGVELSRLHDVAERLGKTEVLVLAAVLVLHALTAVVPAAVRRGAAAD
jgi:hypothetical protein